MSLITVAAGKRPIIATALGITQILAWGSTYYLPAVLAAPIAADTGWPLPWVIAGLSCALLVAGLCAPFIGRTIQRRGGKPVLVASSLLLIFALALLGMATALPVYLLAWVIMGLGMSAGLYDAAFATVGRFYGQSARSTITVLTLFGGFASTVCWPVSAYLVEAYGWRGACFAYAGIHLLVCLPLHLFLVPSLTRATPAMSDDFRVPELPSDAPRRPAVFALLAVILTLSALISSMLSVHLLSIFQLRGYAVAAAVGLGSLIGPSQVGARVVEMLLGRHYHPVWTMVAAEALILAGVVMLLAGLPLPAAALILYGAGNGLHTIARGALPLVLFDPAHYAAFMGRLAFPALVVQALAPSIGAWLLVDNGTLMLTVLSGVAALNVLCTACLWRLARRD